MTAAAYSNGYVAENGYRRVWVIGEGERYAHRVVMEAHLGRRLRADEHVHHRDGDKLNNDLSNLEVLAESTHRRLHAPRVEPKPCQNCRQPAKPLRRGRCNACAVYFRKHDAERPERLYGATRAIRNQWGIWPLRGSELA